MDDFANCMQLAELARSEGRLQDAQSLLTRAVQLCRQKGDATLLAYSVTQLGDTHREVGNLAPADRCYREAIAIYRATADAKRSDLANALRSYALLHDALGRDATALWMEAGEIYDVAGVSHAAAECAEHATRLRA